MKKTTGKGLLQLLLTVIVAGGLLALLYVGYDNDKVKGVKDIGLGLDLDGGLSILYETEDAHPDSEALKTTISRMQKRVEHYSTEAEVYQQGDNQIAADIPGITNAEEILADLGNAGNVYFIYGNGQSGVDNIVYDQATDKWSLTRSMDEIIAAGDLVLDGSGIENAEAMYSNNDKAGQTGTDYYVELTLKSAAREAFKNATAYANPYYNSSSLKGVIAIVYDDEVISAPRAQSVIDSTTATITGSFTYDEVESLANTIKIGALPLKLTQKSYSIVGAQLGSNALSSILKAGAIGILLVMLFMLIVYRIPGAIACVAIAIYTMLDILCIIFFDVTLTLPGIAGVILSVGMAVDGNVIIFTRIREELRDGKTVQSAIKQGFSKATSAIVDGQVTTLIAAIVLYLRGSGTIKGFAITLGIGIVLSLISALLITRFLLFMAYNIGLKNEKLYGIAKKAKVINWTKHFPKFLIVSLLAIVAGVVGLVAFKAKTNYALNYGLDFIGGTSIEVYFDEGVTPPSNAEVEEKTADILGSAPEVVQVETDNAIMLKTDKMIVEEGSSEKASSADASTVDTNSKIGQIKKLFADEYGVSSDKIEVQSISASVSDDMKSDAIWAVIIAGICMLLYIWFRFSNLSSAFSAVLALAHDILVVLAVYALARITVDSAFIACMLTIVGYSINSTIVIFDRIRENNAQRGKGESDADVVNRSISETLSRSINTSFTTLISIIMVAILGVDSIRAFAIPLIVGLVAGAYSSVCITGSLWLNLRKIGKKKK